MNASAAVTLERTTTERGELVLRQVGDRYEIISNGVFLMDTSDGVSERLLIDSALRHCVSESPRLLIGGLGVGFSLNHAAAIGTISQIDVVEIEPTIVGWHRSFLRHLSHTAMTDPRVSVRTVDLIDWLAAPGEPYDVICLDTDNGPNWLVFETNAAIYADSGLDLAYGRLRFGGVLAVWSASRDDAFERRLSRRFGAFEVETVTRERGEPDIVYVARR